MASVQTQPRYVTQDVALIPQEVETLFPRIFQLRNDELGREAVRIMNDRFKGNDYVVLNKLGEKNQPIGYSNPYRRWAIGPVIREILGNDVELLTPAVSEQALRSGKLPDATSTYEDLGIVVYSLNGPNDKLAQHLVAQAKERGVEVKLPMVFYHLKTARDDKFSDGLRLDLDDIAVAYHVPILSNPSSRFKSDDKGLVQNGFPSEVGEGDRTLYIAQEGLGRLYRYRVLDLDANNDNLPYSDGAGRVSFMRKGVAPQNLEARLADLKALRETQIAEVEARFGKAMQIMTGQ
mgnify:CR=1 FL=1